MSLVGKFPPLFSVVNLWTSNGLIYDNQQTHYGAWCITPYVDRWGRFILGSAEAQKVYGAAI